MSVISRVAAPETEAVDAAVGATGLLAGALLHGPRGLRNVENIRPGNLVVTRGQGLCPVRLVWTREVTAAEIAADPALAPIRFAPRAMGPMMPCRPLRLGRAQRVLLPGSGADGPLGATPILAADLVDLATPDPGDGPVVYYHVVFEAPTVFSASGVPVASALPPDLIQRLT